MNGRTCRACLGLLALLAAACAAQERLTITVDQHGNGMFRTIGEALASVADDPRPATIVVGNGEYREKLFITRNDLAIIGTHRDSTRIVFAELRSNWTKAADNRPDGKTEGLDWGAGVINIGDGVTDVVIGNLTVRNDYGSLHGERAHQFTIRGFDATRIALLHCTVISDGGDAVALWNREDGMYYHASCSFEGWVDFVCPRGWCYVTDSRFFGHNLSASIWHDGSGNRDQKFVIRNSFFDGVPGFPLGRHHRDAQILLLDCTFSETMLDRPIYRPVSPNTVEWVWGERHYFHNCRREGGNFAWFADNLEAAEGAPSPGAVTAAWTFGGRWDPERTLPAVLPFASIPTPRNEAYEVDPDRVEFFWIGARGAGEYRLHLGTAPDPPVVAVVTATSFETRSLLPGTQYFWRIDAVTRAGVIPGEVWKFTTSKEGTPKTGGTP